MENKLNKSQSRVCMVLSSSTGVWLNDCLQPQHYYVTLFIKDPNGAVVAEVSLSYEQAARMLLYNGDVPCTLSKYRDLSGNLVSETVTPPATVKDRMNERLKDVTGTLNDRLKDAIKDIHSMINGHTKPGKTNLEELMRNLETVQSHLGSNMSYVVQETEKELAEMQSNMVGQLGMFLQNATGATVGGDALRQLLPVSNEPLLLGEEVSPVVETYTKKERTPIAIDDMTAMEVAEDIQRCFTTIERRLSPTEGHSVLYCARAMHSRNTITIKYVSYQSTSVIELDVAKRYLKFLRSMKNVEEFKHHWDFEKKET